MDIASTVARIKKLCAEKGLTESALAKQAGMHQPTLSKILTLKRKRINSKTLGKIARGLKTSVEHLTGETGELRESLVPYGGTIGDLVKSQELLWIELQRVRAELKELKKK